MFCILTGINTNTMAACFIFYFILNIFIGKSTGRKFVFISVIPGDNAAFKVSVILNVNIKAFVTGINAALVGNACIVTVDIAFGITAGNAYFAGAKVIFQP